SAMITPPTSTGSFCLLQIFWDIRLHLPEYQVYPMHRRISKECESKYQYPLSLPHWESVHQRALQVPARQSSPLRSPFLCMSCVFPHSHPIFSVMSSPAMDAAV